MKKALSILLAVVMVMCALPFSLIASAATSGRTGIAKESPNDSYTKSEGAGFGVFLASMGGGGHTHPSPMAYSTRRSIEC